MTSEQREALRRDFTTWSGGFGPESGQEIWQYLAGSLGIECDPEEATEELLAWTDEPAD